VDSNKDNQADYYFEAYRDTATSVGWDVERSDGKGWSETPDSPTETFSRSGNVYTWTFSQADIGGSTGFNFWVFTHHYAGEAVAARTGSASPPKTRPETSASPRAPPSPSPDSNGRRRRERPPFPPASFRGGLLAEPRDGALRAPGSERRLDAACGREGRRVRA